MIGLATRGYLSPWRTGVSIYGPGPAITDVSSQEPRIDGSSVVATLTPTIVGAPVITSSTLQPPKIEGASIVQTRTPIIIGAGDQSPKIDAGREEP
jgi:hypothetical protein